jgi:protease I
MTGDRQVLLVIGDAAEVTDTLYPFYRVQEDGYRCVVAAPEERTYHLVMHDSHPDWDITVESAGYRFASDVAFRDIDSGDYDGVIISGGRAPEYIRYDEDLLRVVREMDAAGKPIASVCHGIEVIAAADVIRGRLVTTVAKCRYDAESAGGVYVDEPVTVDRNLVCARVFHDSAPWMREYMNLLGKYRSQGADSQGPH